MPDLSFPNNNNNTIIRPFVAGENITQGQILTQHQGLARINKRRYGVETVLSGVSLIEPFALCSCAINSTQALVSNGQCVWVVTSNNDGTAPTCGTPVSITTGAPSGVSMTKLTATTVLIFFGNSAVVATVSGTTVSLGSMVTGLAGGGSTYTTNVTTLSPTVVLVTTGYNGGSGKTSIEYQILTVSGTTITAGPLASSPVYMSLSVYTTVAVLNSTTFAVCTGGSVYAFTYSGTTITQLNSSVNTLYNGNDLDTSTRPLIQGIATIDATHIAMVTSTGFAVGTFNATYSQLIMDQGINNAMFGPILASASSSSVTLVNVDSTHILAYAYGSTAYATCLLTVTSVSTGWALAAGPVNTFNNTAIPSGTALMVSYCALSSSFLLLVQSWLYSSNIYMQTSFIVGDSVDDYGLNLGIAMNTVSSGGTVQVLMSGNSTAIYTGLTAGQKYSNFDGNLVVGPSPQHTMFPVTFQNGSGTAILPAYEADTSATYPYAIALGSNEIQILEPMNMRGVLY